MGKAVGPTVDLRVIPLDIGGRDAREHHSGLGGGSENKVGETHCELEDLDMRGS
jgi:hypothetical protein